MRILIVMITAISSGITIPSKVSGYSIGSFLEHIFFWSIIILFISCTHFIGRLFKGKVLYSQSMAGVTWSLLPFSAGLLLFTLFEFLVKVIDNSNKSNWVNFVTFFLLFLLFSSIITSIIYLLRVFYTYQQITGFRFIIASVFAFVWIAAVFAYLGLAVALAGV